MSLPIDSVLPALRVALNERRAAVLQAPPGAGKTTRVPLALLDEPWLAGRKIIMLEPRRLAARAAATFMARTRNERVGETVGYRVRMDTKIGSRTRIEVVTEGVLGRLLQADPSLVGTGLVIFDEFHERNLHADLGLALALQTRVVLRGDLRILVMSATLDGDPVAALVGDTSGPAPIVTSEGRSFPVETRYVGRPTDRPLEPMVASVVRRALTDDDGDVLVFLPGAAEIRRVEALLSEGGLSPGAYVMPLFGNLSAEAQDRAIAPSAPTSRKVVLATSIAETSLTIEGIRIVVDGGLMRVPRFSARSGMTRLETVRVTRSSADQRRGRAGRVSTGICYRLWSEQEEQQLAPNNRPEILDADLTPLALELAEAGVMDPAELRWIDAPPAPALAHARELLTQLGALDPSGGITPHGRRMASLPVHPRLAHMLLAGSALGHGTLACDLAALLAERDIFRFEAGAPVDADISLRIEALHENPPTTRTPGATIDRATLHRVRAVANDLERGVGPEADRRHHAPRDLARDAPVGPILAFAYPDRIAQRRSSRDDDRTRSGRFLLRSGVGAALPSPQALSAAPYVVVADLGGQPPEHRIFLAAPLTLDEIETHLADQIDHDENVSWDADAGVVRARERQRLGALVLRERAIAEPDPATVLGVLLSAIADNELRDLPWTDSSRQLHHRLAFLHEIDAAWPDVSDAVLRATLNEWLGPHLLGVTRRDELRRLDLVRILLAMLDWKQRAALEELAPSHIEVPSGSRIRVDYSDPRSPVLAVRLQELFGLSDTPRIARGRVPVTLHLLSPAHRPVQVTTDLAGFWRAGYFEVKKQLKGRYPKHYWPDDPLEAVPTRHARPRV